MRWMTLVVLGMCLFARVSAAEPPLVEPYLHSGDLANGEQALEVALQTTPGDDQLRFGLGIVQFVRGVERLGQSLHEYGLKPVDAPFLRLPVPENPDPAAINDAAFRRVLDGFLRDLAVAEATLSGVTDDNVKLPLRLADIRVDLDCDGQPTDKLLHILHQIARENSFRFLVANPEFLVCFDRGDVAWLQAYCHLLMGMLDFYLAFDTETAFASDISSHFAKQRNPSPAADEELQRRRREEPNVAVVKEPERLSRSRKHFIRVAELNHETWKHIRAEEDDDHEWLPNPKQRGVLGLPVRDNMIDAWLEMMTEFKGLLEGERLVPRALTDFDRKGKGLNLKTFLDDPPKSFLANVEFAPSLPDKYFSDGRDLNLNVLFRILWVFNDTPNFAYGYVIWFN